MQLQQLEDKPQQDQMVADPDLRHENDSKFSSTRHFHPSDCCNDTSARDYHEPDKGKELVNLTDRHKLQSTAILNLDTVLWIFLMKEKSWLTSRILTIFN
ncbi:hypothetical protein JTE90_027555 [Oedothorax gibbosus]|uniref:Uncharacterized protein n=1 Tax=Oedothorax gibbosus TaxID=931172 RepID=A0AAV6VJ61_9ARAC|nr:hypothetical protein JTE90_027555 [Oedothorax gibbosus]